MIAAGPIGRVPAQRLARLELARPMYHRHSLAGYIANALDRLFRATNGATPGGWWSLVALAALAVISVAAITIRLGPPTRSARHGPSLHERTTSALSARELRDLADSCAAAGDASAAILHRVRAIAVALEERSVLRPDNGRTADEMAHQVAARYPVERDALTDAAAIFDRICYGDVTGTADEYGRVRALDERLAERKPQVAAAS